MSHLNPVIRPDKNGKMVTRHVKAMSQSSSSIPPVYVKGLTAASGPTLEAAKGKRALLGYITTSISIREVPQLCHSQVELGDLVRELPVSTVELFHKLEGSMTPNGMYSKFLARLVIKALDAEIEPTDIESAVYYYGQTHDTGRDEIDENFEVGDRMFPSHPIGNYLSAVKSYQLNGFDFNPGLPVGQQTEHTLQQCEALRELHYTSELAEYWEPKPLKPFKNDGTLIDPRLAQLVVDRPEVTSVVTELIYERETLDYEFIAGVLSNEAQALSEGTL